MYIPIYTHMNTHIYNNNNNNNNRDIVNSNKSTCNS